MKRVLMGCLCIPLVIACVVENTTAPPPPPPPPAPLPTDTATATATPTATATATAAADAGPGAAQDAGPSDDGGGAPAQYRACKTDSDCVAVPRVGCCDLGWKEAVATSQQSAYAASFHCQERAICPQYKVQDTRVALCENTSHLCTMEKPEEVHCGGFVVNAHKCPPGYTCPHGKNPDVGSICVKSP